MEEHRIDPVTGEMDLDFMDALFLVESEHREKFREMEHHYLRKIDHLEADREMERNDLLQAQRESEERLRQDKEIALEKLRATQQHQVKKLIELEEDQQKLSRTLRGTLPSLPRFLAIYGFAHYQPLLEHYGVDSMEKLLLCSEQDLKEAGLKVGHIRKMLTILKSMQSTAPKVLMPDGAVKALKPTLTTARPPSSGTDHRPDTADSNERSSARGEEGQTANSKTNGASTNKNKSKKASNKKKKKKKSSKQVNWIVNRDSATGRRYLVHPLSGETKWEETDDGMSISRGQEQEELLFSDESDTELAKDLSASSSKALSSLISGKLMSMKLRPKSTARNNSTDDKEE
jgi:hypothetical protein